MQVRSVKLNTEAIKNVKTNRPTNPIRAAPVLQSPTHSLTCCNITKETSGMFEIINCSAQTSRRTERTTIIAKAAEKYLNMEEMSVELSGECAGISRV